MEKKYKYRTRFTYAGKRYSVYADTQRELGEKKARKLMELEQGRVILSSSTTVSDWIEQCMETYKRPSVDSVTYDGMICGSISMLFRRSATCR